MTKNTTTKDRIMDAAEELVHNRGFSSTSVDTILAKAEASKGAFFHHFPSKEDLGNALLRRYAESDAEMLEEFVQKAEEVSDDPAVQVVSMVAQFAEMADAITADMPGCLFVSFIYERGPTGLDEDDIIVESIELWRNTILEKLEAAVADRPDLSDVDLPSLADTVFSAFEGGFILVRATNDPSHLGKQLTHLRRYMELLLGVEAP